MTHIHKNRWSWGETATIITHDGAAMVDLYFEDVDPNVCYLAGLSVVPECRQQGYARELLSMAIDYCIKRGIFRIDLNSVQEPFVMDLYHKLGFNDIKVENDMMKMYLMLR